MPPPDDKSTVTFVLGAIIVFCLLMQLANAIRGGPSNCGPDYSYSDCAEHMLNAD